MYKKSMTIHEFMELNRAHEEAIAARILRDKKLKAMVVFVLGNLMYVQNALAVGGDMKKIDLAGFTILGICRRIGYWACIIMCVVEIIKALMHGDSKSITKIIAKYALGFGTLYFVPWLFDLIKTIF